MTEVLWAGARRWRGIMARLCGDKASVHGRGALGRGTVLEAHYGLALWRCGVVKYTFRSFTIDDGVIPSGPRGPGVVPVASRLSRSSAPALPSWSSPVSTQTTTNLRNITQTKGIDGRAPPGVELAA